MGKGIPLGAKLFLEGIEVPFIGATITCAVNRASIAYIDVVPLEEIKHIKPRTLVHLFVRDITDPGNFYPYVLAWEGEVFGFSYGRTISSRMFTIKAIDYTAYWDSALVHFWDAQKTLGGLGAAKKFLEDQGAVFKDIAEAGRQNVASRALLNTQVTYYFKTLKGYLDKGEVDFLGALIKLLDELGGMNDFFEMGEDKLRVSDRYIQNSSGQLEKLLKNKNLLTLLKGAGGRRNGLFPIRALIMDIMGIIFHDYVGVPFPSQVTREILKGGKAPLKSADQKQRTIASFLFKPNTYMLSPPACNIFFPDEYSSFQYDRNFFAEPTRLTYRPVPAISDLKKIAIDHVYQPDSFHHFCYGGKDSKSAELRKPDTYQGEGEDLVPKLKDENGDDLDAYVFPGFYQDGDTRATSKVNGGNKKDFNFITNAEMFKGIWAAHETEMPAVMTYLNDVKNYTDPEFTKKIAKYLLFKKRYEGRSLQITSHLKLSAVPGFPVLVLDDSPAKQSTIAYCESITHRIYANQGGYTNTVLSYARDVEEQDSASENGKDPIVPDWFSEILFGNDSTVGEDGRRFFPKGLANFYKSLLGEKGYKDLASLVNTPTSNLANATEELLKKYRAKKSAGSGDLTDFIAKTTRRHYVPLDAAFGFLGASTKDPEESNYMVFKGNRLLGKKEVPDTKAGSNSVTLAGKKYEVTTKKTVDTSDKFAQTTRRKIISRYQKKLKERRGFVG